MIGVVVAGVIALVAVLTAIWPGWVRGTFFWNTELPSDIDGRTYVWPIRAIAITLVAVALVLAVGSAAPLVFPRDETLHGILVAGTVVVLGVGLAIWFVAAIVARRDRDSRIVALVRAYNAERQPGEEYQPEPRGPGIALEVLLAGAIVVAVAVAGISLGIATGVLTGGGTTLGAEPEPTPTPTGYERTPADEAIARMTRLTSLEQLGEAPETGSVVDPWDYAIVDAEQRLPANAWNQSQPTGGGTSDELLADADLLVTSLGFSCTATGIVVVETAEAVQIGLAVVETPDPESPAPLPCSSTVLIRTWWTVDLAAPLGDRRVEGFTGRSISAYRAPIR